MSKEENKNLQRYLVLEYIAGLKHDKNQVIHIYDKNVINSLTSSKPGNLIPYMFHSSFELGNFGKGYINLAKLKRKFTFSDNNNGIYKIKRKVFQFPEFSYDGYLKAIERDCVEESKIRSKMAMHYVNNISYKVVDKELKRSYSGGSYVSMLCEIHHEIDRYLILILKNALKEQKTKNNRITSLHISPFTCIGIFSRFSMVGNFHPEEVLLNSNLIKKIFKISGTDKNVGEIFNIKVKISNLVPNDSFVLCTNDEEIKPERMYKLGFKFEIDEIQELMND